jgi:hypothetical protein
MVAVDPNKSALRGPAAFLDDDGRRTDANHNLRKGRRRSQGESQQ